MTDQSNKIDKNLVITADDFTMDIIAILLGNDTSPGVVHRAGDVRCGPITITIDKSMGMRSEFAVTFSAEGVSTVIYAASHDWLDRGWHVSVPLAEEFVGLVSKAVAYANRCRAEQDAWFAERAREIEAKEASNLEAAKAIAKKMTQETTP